MLIISSYKQKVVKCLHTLSHIPKNVVNLHGINSTCLLRIWRKGIQTEHKNGPWNVLFFGTDDFALESLQSLYNEHKCKTLARLEVVTTYGRKENPVVQYAKQHNIVIHTWPLKKIVDFHIGVVVSFGHLIPCVVINSFPLGMINVHASLLPRWRGAAPIIHSLKHGDSQTGITIMKIMPKKFDIGEIIAQKCIDVQSDETMPELREKLAKTGAAVLIETLRQLPYILSTSRPQSSTGVTYAPKVTRDISLIKWREMTAENVYNLQRALTGLYPISTKFQNMVLKLFDVKQIEKPTNVMNFCNEAPGFAQYSRHTKELIVKCKGDTWISVKKVAIPGRPPMTAQDFNNGFITGLNKRSVTFQ